MGRGRREEVLVEGEDEVRGVKKSKSSLAA